MRKSHSLIALIVLLAVSATAVLADEAPAPAPSGVVNINTADATQLALLPRVGAKAAQRILDWRREHGNFHKTADLMQVKGFGAKTFERLAAYVTVDGKTTLTEKVKSPRKARAKKQPTPTASN